MDVDHVLLYLAVVLTNPNWILGEKRKYETCKFCLLQFPRKILEEQIKT